MFENFVKWIKGHTFKQESNIDQKKNVLKEWINHFGIQWKHVEDVMFWNIPLLSLSIYLVFVGIFWKLISYELQRIAMIVLLTSGLTVISEIRGLISQFLTEKSFINVKPENKRLGFNLDDVIRVSAEFWVLCESHYIYLVQLKEAKDPKFCFYLAIYLSLVITIFTYVPVAEVLFIFGTFVYFYPVFVYLGVIEKLFERVERLARPVAVHWVHNRTKRKRNNRLRKLDRVTSPSSTDTDDEEFLPYKRQQQKTMVPPTSSTQSGGSESNNEFDIREKIHRQNEDGNSSDFDEDSFLPTNHHTTGGAYDTLPSLSQFDSLMEPLDDDFHAGLDFNNVTARSVSDFGIPDNLRQHIPHDDDTDDDIDDIPIEDIPVEETDGETRYANLVSTKANASYGHTENVQQQQQQKDFNRTDEREISPDQDFELLDRTELQNVTDEEINEQNVGQQSSPSIVQGVSNMLGY